MAFRVLPEKKYRLNDGTLGTEKEALAEVLKNLETQKRFLEERIEITRLKYEQAEG